MSTPVRPGVALVPWNDTHDANTVRWLADPTIRASFGITAQVTLEGHRRWRSNNANVVGWAITQQGAHCGNMLLDINRRHDSAYLQIYLGEASSQGHGLGRAAMTMSLDQAFGPLTLHRVWLHTRPENVRAQRLYESLGFQLEGTERESIKTAGGYLSQLRWSLLAPQWAKR